MIRPAVRPFVIALALAGTVTACAADPDDTAASTATWATTPPEETTAAGPSTTATGPTGSTTAPTASTPATTTSTVSVPPSDDAVDLEVVAEDLTAPVDLVALTDGTLLVAQQTGQVVALSDDGTGRTLLDISAEVADGGEQGLLGIVVSPDGDHLVVSSTDRGGDTLVTEYEFGGDGTLDPDTRRVLFTAEQPYANHNGGDVAIGPDGMLYLGLGDGGSADDPERRALDLRSPLGKVLRLDPWSDPTSSPAPAAAGNPFTDVPGAHPAIWLVGVRNPWRFSFDSATGDLWIADVGQNEWEEIDVLRAGNDGLDAGRGVSLGWSALEGTHPFHDDQSGDGAIPPVFEYPHGEQGCSVSGGAVVRDGSLLDGWYVFSDYCSGVVRAIPSDEDLTSPGTAVAPVRLGSADSVSAVCTGDDGTVYVLTRGGEPGTGRVARLVGVG